MLNVKHSTDIRQLGAIIRTVPRHASPELAFRDNVPGGRSEPGDHGGSPDWCRLKCTCCYLVLQRGLAAVAVDATDAADQSAGMLIQRW